MEKVETFIKDLMATRDVLRLYSENHPEFLEASKKAFATLQDILNEEHELVIGIVGDEFTYKKEIFFTLSERLRLVIEDFKKKNIERLAFYRGVEQEELNTFVSFLVLPQEEYIGDSDDYLARHGISHISVGKIKTGSPLSLVFSENIIEPQEQIQLYEKSIGIVTESIQNVLDDKVIDYQNLKFAINTVMLNLLDHYQDFLRLGTVKRYDQITFIHLVNVSILSMHFAVTLGFNKNDVLEIGIAALFHDIGKLYISRKLLSKPDKLMPEEFDIMQNHARLGAEIMLEHVDSLGLLPVIVSYEHHVKYNLEGYPKLPSFHTPHVASLIISLCDVYDALRQRRSYKRNYPPEMAYTIMHKARGEAFYPELFDRFFQMIGVWPVGTIVLLNDGRIAIVREQNTSSILHPIVEVVGPEYTKEMINLKEHKEKILIEKSLNPHDEGKEYNKFI